MPGQVIHYLLVYNLAEGRVDVLRPYADGAEALDAYADLERSYRDRYDQFEVVLLGADSEEALHATHAHYFATQDDETTSHFSSLLPA